MVRQKEEHALNDVNNADMDIYECEGKYMSNNPTLQEFLSKANVGRFNSFKIPFHKIALLTLQQTMATKCGTYKMKNFRDFIMTGQINTLAENIGAPNNFGTLIT